MTDELRKGQETFRGSAPTLQAVLRAIPVPVAITRVSDGKFLYSNEHHRNAFGLPPIEGSISLKSPELYCNPDDRVLIGSRLAVLGQAVAFELTLHLDVLCKALAPWPTPWAAFA